MARTEHSAASLKVRDALLALGDADRRRLTGLYGAMQYPQPDPSIELIRVLRVIGALDTDDHIRIARWIRTYCNRWGQIPVAESHRIKPGDR